MTNRLAPRLNIPTSENQRAYEERRSTMVIIFYIEQQFVKNEIQGLISFDLSEAFGRINRNELWWILYEKGFQIRPIQMIIQRHMGNIPKGKRLGILGA